MSKPVWLRTDAQREAVRALEIFRFHLTWVPQEPHSWKWALISLHSAIHSLIVASFSGPALLGTLKPFVTERPPPGGGAVSTRVVPVPDYFLELYARMKEETCYEPGTEVDLAIARLNELRNAFVHLTPACWLVHLNELPGLALESLQVVETLAWFPGHVPWQTEDLREAAMREGEGCRQVLRELEIEYRS